MTEDKEVELVSIKMVKVTLKGLAHFRRRCPHCGHEWLGSVPVHASAEDMRTFESAAREKAQKNLRKAIAEKERAGDVTTDVMCPVCGFFCAEAMERLSPRASDPGCAGSTVYRCCCN